MKVSELPRLHEDWRGHTAGSYGDLDFSVGRYELNRPDGTRMRVDYAIDPLLAEGKYGHVSSFFVSRMNSGENIEYARIVVEKDTPKIGMGDFDFTHEGNKGELEKLLAGNIRTDVARVIRDTLLLSAEGNLERIPAEGGEIYVAGNS